MYDLTTDEGLRSAYRTAERLLDEKVTARNAEFLQQVRDTPEAERDSEEFQRLVWDENPLAGLGHGDYDVSGALADLDFRRQFRELTGRSLPEGPKKYNRAPKAGEERAKKIDEVFVEVLDLVQPYVPPNKRGERHRPRVKTVRALSAVFPNDFTALIHSSDRNRLLKSMGEKTGNENNPAQADRRILDRFDGAIGVADRSDWNSVARSMKLSWFLLKLHDEGGGMTVELPDLKLISRHLETMMETHGLVFDQETIESLHLGLWANDRRHFGVLTGLSGTGKTQIALKYADALTGATGESNEQVCTVPVQPGWYDPTPLLGYVNPLGESRYMQTDFLRFLLRASKNRSKPYVCVLDEMNLSHPEQYLAPILSAMEREDGDIPLHGGDGDEYGVSPSIRFPQNLILIGTVNMDETTMGISDKVLDRAFTLEFWDIDVDRWPGWDEARIEGADKAAVKEVLKRLMDALSPARLHFGWRVIADVVQFMVLRQGQSGELSVGDALDRVIYAKVLPKLRGDDSPRSRDALAKCEAVLKARNLTRCADKVAELIQDLNEIGSFRFWR